jgi:hypothetical protein
MGTASKKFTLNIAFPSLPPPAPLMKLFENQELIQNIARFLDPTSLKAFRLTNSSISSALSNQQKERIKVFNWKFPGLVEILGGPSRFCKLPVLDNGMKLRSTAYIDFLQPNDVPGPISIGVDCFRRRFVAFRLRYSDTTTDCWVTTLFQRYTNGSFFNYGGRKNASILTLNSHELYFDENDEITSRLKEIVAGRHVIECSYAFCERYVVLDM